MTWLRHTPRQGYELPGRFTAVELSRRERTARGGLSCARSRAAPTCASKWSSTRAGTLTVDSVVPLLAGRRLVERET